MKKRIVKYPKLIIFLLTIVIGYLIFLGRNLDFFQDILSSSGYFGVFVSGIMFAYGFTTAPSTAIFLIIGELGKLNIFLVSIIGGFGALCGDYLIFRLIRTGLKDEIKRIEIKLEKTETAKEVEKLSSFIPKKIKHYLIILFAELIIASPIPDEIGVAILSVNTKISRKIFILISLVMNTLGIFIIMLIGR